MLLRRRLLLTVAPPSPPLSVTFLTGFPYIALSIIIPERFQMVDGDQVLLAGVRLLPLLGACAVGSFLGGFLSSKRNNTSYTLIAASCLELLGVGLMTLTSSSQNEVAQYGYQAIFGLGVGLSFSAATIMTSILATDPKVRASAQGAVAQARVLGGCLGLAVCTILFNIHVNRHLEGALAREQIDELRRSPLSGLRFPPSLRDLVKNVYIGAFTQEIQVMGLVCAVMVVVSLLTLERNPTPLEKLTGPACMARQPKDAVSSSFRRGSDSGTEINTISSVQHAV